MQSYTTRPTEPNMAQAPIDTPDPRAQTLDLLEFAQIRTQLAERTSFLPARRLALELTPSWTDYEVALLQDETVDARKALDNGGDVNLHTRSDISEPVARAALGSILTGTELLAIAETLDVHQTAKRSILSVQQHAPILADIAKSIPDLREIPRQIRRRIGPRGEVMDDATHTLRAIRSQMRHAYQRVTHSLNSLIQATQADNALQDDVISIRNDRLVLQVKAEMRSRIPGIVHDASNTGATLFVEPFSTVEMGNEWRELILAEEREIRQVLRDLSTLVGELAPDITIGNELTAQLDFILARARYGYAIKAVAPAAPDGDDKTVRLVNARHPLLGQSAVPVNISIGPQWSALIITGPNTGGKTVAMKTVGILALMHQAGLHIPAEEGSILPVFDGVFADVGDQQSIQQSVSTFSSHIRNVIHILNHATPQSLVLLDELGTSTDAEEGSALAKAILEHLASNSVSTIATTHHRSVAAHAETTDQMMNASVQLDPDSLTPTYRLTLGIPGRSYAMAIAASLGMPPEILQNAQTAIEPQYLRFEDWLTELQRERNQLQTMLQDTEQARANAETLRQRLNQQMEYLEAHRADILDSVRRHMMAKYEATERKLKRAEAALSWTAPSASGTPAALASRPRREDIAHLRSELATARAAAPAPAPIRPEQRALAVGDKVFVRGLNLSGVIASISHDRKEADIGIGSVRIQVQLSRLSLIEAQPEPPAPEVRFDLSPMLGSSELDIRGMRAEESLAQLEQFLDKAVRDGFTSVRIIHGKGKGILRNVVREHLQRHPLAHSFEAEARERGGDGATLVQLA